MPPVESPPSAVSLEETEEALLEGDSRFAPGTAMSALRHRDFFIMYLGGFLSNIGTWMQSVALGALAFHLANAAWFVGLLLFAQMGPTLVVGPFAGVIADSFDRKRLLVGITIVQLAAATALAFVTVADSPSKVGIVITVLIGGIANSVFGPAYSAVLPAMVGREDLPGAISLQSAQMNISRVVGPLLGAAAYPLLGFSGLFFANAASFLFVTGSLLMIHLPPEAAEPAGEAEQGWTRLTSGFRIARQDPVVGRALVTIATFSSLSLLWVGQFPVFAAENLHVDEESGTYQILYACFGLGAAIGSIAIGTVLARQSKAKLVRIGLVAYAVVYAVYSQLRGPVPAFFVVCVLGILYFGSVTALNTAMQERLENHQRGRIMALWMMGFGGAVSLANFVLGPVVDAVGMPPLMLGGAVVAVLLAWYADVRSPEERAAARRSDGKVTAPAAAGD